MKKLLCLLFAFPALHAHAETSPFEQVFDAISNPRVFDMSFSKILAPLNGLCKKSTRTGVDLIKNGNVECTKNTDVESLTISGSETPTVSMIQASFTGADKCEAMKKILVERFGKPGKTSGACDVSWNLKPLKKGGPRRVAGIEAAKDKIYFSYAEEQG
ncbi:hypothetical protein [Undibacterium sp. TJN19]|uniref:hypothetical protein n=1 Tax=Undibacterium sp. TJN19 TaxID=3413055 RepID=UPI003BF2BE0C